MKQQLLAILLIALICSSEAVSLRRATRVTPLEELDQKINGKSEFGSNLFVAINLSLQSGGKVDEVIDFVRQAHNDAISQRNDLTANFRVEEAKLQTDIQSLGTELNVLNGQMTIVLENIDQATLEIANITGTLQRLKAEQQAINERRNALEEARENDRTAFSARQKRDQNTISALEQIIPALENLQQNGSMFLEKSHKDIVMALQRIPENRPIQMLVELSTKFNAEKLGTVIEKLQVILESVQTSRSEDKQAEETSIIRYQSLSLELESLYHTKSRQVNAAQTDLDAKEQTLRHNVSFRDQITGNLQQTNDLKVATETILETTTATYNTNLKSANEAIAALKAALDILTENEATLEVQETQADQDVAQ